VGGEGSTRTIPYTFDPKPFTPPCMTNCRRKIGILPPNLNKPLTNPMMGSARRSMVDMAMEGRWEGKGVAVFYLELTLDLLHLMVYAAFFSVVFSHYGVPLYLVSLWTL
jgi:hypothetical protein